MGAAARVWAAKRTTQPRACFAYTEGPGKAIVYTGAPKIGWLTTLKYSCKSVQGFMRDCERVQLRLHWNRTLEPNTGTVQHANGEQLACLRSYVYHKAGSLRLLLKLTALGPKQK